jgi:hypothetical protein
MWRQAGRAHSFWGSALRETKSPAKALGFLDPAVLDETLLEAMIEHPILVNRPIVCTTQRGAANHPLPRKTVIEIVGFACGQAESITIPIMKRAGGSDEQINKALPQRMEAIKKQAREAAMKGDSAKARALWHSGRRPWGFSPRG